MSGEMVSGVLCELNMNSHQPHELHLVMRQILSTSHQANYLVRVVFVACCCENLELCAALLMLVLLAV